MPDMQTDAAARVDEALAAALQKRGKTALGSNWVAITETSATAKVASS
jgi:hypothetical protein